HHHDLPSFPTRRSSDLEFCPSPASPETVRPGLRTGLSPAGSPTPPPHINGRASLRPTLQKGRSRVKARGSGNPSDACVECRRFVRSEERRVGKGSTGGGATILYI